MATNVVRFERASGPAWGTLENGKISPFADAYATTGDFVTAWAAGARPAGLEPVDESAVRLLSPVTANQQFVCQGANYRQHMIESGMNPDDKTYNMIFTKAPSCIAPAGSDCVRPKHVKLLDYEIELGIVFRRALSAAATFTDANLHEYVAGICIVNDYSARDVQIPQTQFYKGKSYRTFGPVGPYLCMLEPADMHYLKTLDLLLTVNGTKRQADTTANLVYGPAETLTELSALQDFAPGDLLATGTPAGCALRVPSAALQKVVALLPEALKWKLFVNAQSKSPAYLKPGDVVESRIRSRDGKIDLGVQRNTVVAG